MRLWTARPPVVLYFYPRPTLPVHDAGLRRARPRATTRRCRRDGDRYRRSGEVPAGGGWLRALSVPAQGGPLRALGRNSCTGGGGASAPAAGPQRGRSPITTRRSASARASLMDATRSRSSGPVAASGDAVAPGAAPGDEGHAWSVGRRGRCSVRSRTRRMRELRLTVQVAAPVIGRGCAGDQRRLSRGTLEDLADLTGRPLRDAAECVRVVASLDALTSPRR